MQKSALKLTNADTVATAMEEIKEHELVAILDTDGRMIQEIQALANIPEGHKIALQEIKPDDTIIKYGYSIGTATELIEPGDHIHTRNLSSTRGRGDL